MSAYYNEIDPFAAEWLRRLIAAGHIAAGDVDSRSIADVKADDLKGYVQCHFFAGIGVWSYALRQAGWPDDRPVWTGSCPCQPFSAAGKREGIGDERHLWPAWFKLIEACRPPVIFGEQVASSEVVGSQLEASFVVAVRSGDFARANGVAHKLARSSALHYWPRWVDSVCAEMEGIGYAMRPEVLGAHSVGAPHIRQRLYFVAESAHQRHERAGAARRRRYGFEDFSATRELADSMPAGRIERRAESGGRRITSRCGESGVALGDTHDAGSQGRSLSGADRERDGGSELAARQAGSADGVGIPDSNGHHRPQAYQAEQGSDRAQGGVHHGTSATAGGFWSACDWLPCIDGKARPVEPGTFPLAHGAPARVGRLRAYGNAICAETAREFIEAYLAR